MRTSTLVMALLLISSLSWGQFYERLPQQKRRELAEAYYLVGSQYIRGNQAAKGREFQAMAFNIDPRLEPDKIQLKDEATAVELIASQKALMLTRPVEEQAVRDLLRAKFMRLAGAFLAGNANMVLGELAGSIQVEGREFSQEQVHAELNRFFEGNSLRGLVPSELYDLQSLTLTRNPSGTPDRWGETWRLDIRALRDFSGSIAFWKPNQSFWVHRRGSDWRIMAVGGMPSRNWSPREPKPLSLKPLAAEDQGTAREVQAAFLSCLQSFLEKDLAGAGDFLYPEVQILRLNTTLTRQEMLSTFEGYFESSNFTGVRSNDVVDPNSIFAEPTDRFEAEIGPGAWLLTVQSRLDLSDQIPFWTRFQEYFFTRQGGSWQIFAIF